MTQRNPDEHERSAAGLDFDDGANHDKAETPGAKMPQEGPGALLDELENLLPEAWRDPIRAYPVAAMALGLGVGVFLGMKKSDEIIAAATSFVTATAMSNVSHVIGKVKG